MLETYPKPSIQKLPEYYLSEDYISHTDSKRNIKEKLYHWVKGYMLNIKLKLLEDCNSESKILLDIGCGTGDFLKTAKNSGWKVFGIEPSLTARQLAVEKNGECVYDLKKLDSFSEDSFDAITLWHVLEHLSDLSGHLNIYKKILKSKGKIVIAVPNFKSYDADYYKEHWAAYDVPRHLWHFSQSSIKKLFAEHGFVVKEIKPMWFDSFYVSLLSEGYKSKNILNPLKAFLVGLRSNLKAKSSGEYSSLIYVIEHKT